MSSSDSTTRELLEKCAKYTPKQRERAAMSYCDTLLKEFKGISGGWKASWSESKTMIYAFDHAKKVMFLSRPFVHGAEHIQIRDYYTKEKINPEGGFVTVIDMAIENMFADAIMYKERHSCNFCSTEDFKPNCVWCKSTHARAIDSVLGGIIPMARRVSFRGEFAKKQKRYCTTPGCTKYIKGHRFFKNNVKKHSKCGGLFTSMEPVPAIVVPSVQ